MADPKTARETATLILAHLIHYPIGGSGCYEADLHYLTVELEDWAERASGPKPTIVTCEWCEWYVSFSAETIAEEAYVLRQALVDHCLAKHEDKFKSPEAGGRIPRN